MSMNEPFRLRHDAWTSRKSPHRHVIVTNRFDRDDLDEMLKNVPAFSRASNNLQDFVETGGPAISDAFFSFLKGVPTSRSINEMDLDYLVNHRVNQEMRDLPETDRLRRFSIGDEVQSAFAVEQIEPELETLFDRLDIERKQAQDLKQVLQELNDALQEKRNADEMVEAWKADNSSGDEEGEGASSETDEQGDSIPQDLADQQADASSRVEDLEDKAERALKEMKDALDRVGDETRQALRQPISEAADKAEEFYDTASGWGLEKGEIQRLPADERLELAKRLNNDHFRRIADLFGPMKNLMLTEQRRKVSYAREELFDVTVGDDFSRALPSDLLLLDQNEDEFMRRLVEKKLLQYDLRGEEKLSRGGIIFCEDGSYSMQGEPERWAKAVMLCLMHLARKQRRSFHLIHFGSPGQFIQISFEKPQDYSLDRILEAAEVFFASGTDFHTPMTVALDILRTQHEKYGAVKSDVVFATDDECQVQAKFMEDYLAESERLQFTTYGFAIPHLGGRVSRTGALHQMCQHKVFEISDLLSGKQISEVFGKL